MPDRLRLIALDLTQKLANASLPGWLPRGGMFLISLPKPTRLYLLSHNNIEDHPFALLDANVHIGSDRPVKALIHSPNISFV